MTAHTYPLDVAAIKELLPHREPFLMLDKVISCTPHESVTAIKNVTANEPHFAGHFPGNPVLPGVLIIEAMAQAGGVLSHISNGDLNPRPLYFLARVEDARFRRPVVPGEQLRIQVHADKVKRGMWWYRCEAMVGKHVVASATIICAPGGD
ncbi:MAG: 3-hydroxyacyl-ACP dehydratase FabZ [Gammaproteobacteria bacterium]|nr:3-hydroxyacyl-ACP dehydratase FabZ [Gammaproteobacteria bacterium]MDH3372758.1 3-hydroxyacyl-ACP dehydratase FabZ [Gammaproteobacteria bacterium]MDH3552810.1 3-hydroxyacyl-ACP dehydratase FabZ [Gammaproteobacteria bacterium]